MDTKTLFKSAHEMARKVRRTGDSYQVTFGACLRAIKAHTQILQIEDYAEIIFDGGKSVRLTDRKTCNAAYFARVVANQRAHKAQIPTGYRNVTKSVEFFPGVNDLLSQFADAQYRAHHASVQNAMTLGGRSL